MVYYEYFNGYFNGYFRGGVELTRVDQIHSEQLLECEEECTLFAELKRENGKIAFIPYVDEIKLTDLITFYDMVEDKMIEIFHSAYLVNKSPVKRANRAKDTVVIDKVVNGNNLFPQKYIDFRFTPLVTTKGWGIQINGSVNPTLSMLEHPRKSYVKNFWSHEMSSPNDITAYKILQTVFHDDCGLSVGDLTEFEIKLLTAFLDQSINRVRNFVNNGKL